MAVGVNPTSRERGRDRSDQVHDEQPAQSDGAQRERWRRQVEGDVGEYRNLGEQHAEADGVGREQLPVAQVIVERAAAVPGMVRRRRARFGRQAHR
jgi:hypothetical protein